MCVDPKNWNEQDGNKQDGNDQEIAAFEQRLRVAIERRAAPAGLKQRVLAEAARRRQRQSWLPGRRFSAGRGMQGQGGEGRGWMLQRIAASALLAVLFGGFAVYERHQKQVAELLRGEEAREQVLTAMRITTRTLGRVNARLADESR